MCISVYLRASKYKDKIYYIFIFKHKYVIQCLYKTIYIYNNLHIFIDNKFHSLYDSNISCFVRYVNMSHVPIT